MNGAAVTFAYNTAIMHVNTTVIHTTYVNETIVHNNTIVNNRHVAYNGGPGGIRHDPTPQERIVVKRAARGRDQRPGRTCQHRACGQDSLCQG